MAASRLTPDLVVLPSADDVRDALAGYAPDIAFQPILDLSRARVSSYEALARFPEPSGDSPQAWFAAARSGGLGPALEARAVAVALELGRHRPAGTVLSLNASPSVLTTPEFRAVLPHDLTGLQFEVTENELVPDPPALAEMLTRLRRRGARIAVDDVGEGYAGLQRVMEMQPDVLKLDRALVTDVHREPAKAALVDAVVRYAAKTGALVCAEGVECADELTALADLDVVQAQGFLIGRPSRVFEPPNREALDLCRASSGGVLRPEARGAVEPVLARLADATGLRSLNRSLAEIAALVRADVAAAAFLSSDGSVLRGLYTGSDVLADEVFPVEDYPVAARVLADRDVALISSDDADSAPDEVVVLRDLGFRTALLVPMAAAGRAVGLLELFRQDGEPWTRAHVRIARTAAAVLGPVAAALRPRGL
ncbi:MAG TPA: EAL domain-containing protein [Mycobacteriales bacterium]|jgi:EAL domain-containing protein (putative c-di-GMP-specific phosphodiesterase class I)